VRASSLSSLFESTNSRYEYFLPRTLPHGLHSCMAMNSIMSPSIPSARTGRRGVLGLTFAAVLLMTAKSPAQPPPVGPAGSPWHSPRLVPLEQGVEDRSELDATQRIQQVDLSVPGGFRQVYRVPGRDDLLMRINGGMYAVFPESFYQRGRGAVIPPGTVFHIGEPSAHQPLSPGQKNNAADIPVPPRGAVDSRVNGQWDRRITLDQPGVSEVNGRFDPNGLTEAGVQGDGAMPRAASMSPVPAMPGMSPMSPPRIPRSHPPVIRTVATDEVFRMQRLSELLDRATEAAKFKAP